MFTWGEGEYAGKIPTNPTSVSGCSDSAPEKKRWFRNAQRWRTGCEGRISLLKRRHGLNRCRYKGLPGIKHWVGLGVLADNLINIGQALASSAER
jgi:transposase, IS5 family